MRDVKESPIHHIEKKSRFFYACALGLAWIGKHNSAQEARDKYREHCRLKLTSGKLALAKLLGIPKFLADRVETAHCNKKKASTIAKMLESGKI